MAPLCCLNNPTKSREKYNISSSGDQLESGIYSKSSHNFKSHLDLKRPEYVIFTLKQNNYSELPDINVMFNISGLKQGWM